jgi:DNA-directed RNA polymerase specialized sigma subunit
MRRYEAKTVRDVSQYESRIHELRVKKGLTVKALAEKAKVYISDVVSLANGTRSPFYKTTNTIKKQAQAIATVLNVDVQELFPAYFCMLPLHVESFEYSDIIEATMSTSEHKPDEKIEADELWKHVKEALKKNINNYLVLYYRYHEDMTLDEIGVILNKNSERIRQIEAKALRILRHPSYRYTLLDYINH